MRRVEDDSSFGDHPAPGLADEPRRARHVGFIVARCIDGRGFGAGAIASLLPENEPSIRSAPWLLRNPDPLERPVSARRELRGSGRVSCL